MRVQLLFPKDPRAAYPSVHGAWLAYNGKCGRVVAGAGSGGAFVQFDDTPPQQYVGCPVCFLHVEQVTQ